MVADPQGSDEIDGDPVDAAGHQPGILAQVATLILQVQSSGPALAMDGELTVTGTMLSRLKAAWTATLDLVLAPTPWHLSANSSTRVAHRVADGELPAHRHSTSDPTTFTGCAIQMLIKRCFVGALAAAWLLALATSAFAQSGEHGNGHLQMHDIYQNWHPPLNPGTSCCNDADCRPTRAIVDDQGQWRAWNGSAWLIVPQERVLPTDYAGDGRSHLCEKEGFVYCFTPGEIRG